jgi:microcystin-dependent protein
MTTEYTSNSITVTIPSLSDNANVVAAFQNYHDDVANAIASKQVTITGAATSVLSTNLASNVVVVSTATGKLANSSITTSELGHLSGISSQTQILNPTGMVVPYAGFTAPNGWLFCNGATISKSSYPGLANVLTVTGDVNKMKYENYTYVELSIDTIKFTMDTVAGLPQGGTIDGYPFYGYIVADSTAMSASGLGTYFSANTMYQMVISGNEITIIQDPLTPTPSNFQYNNVFGDGYNYSIQIVVNNYRKTTSYPAAPSISQTVLPNLISRVVNGPSVMGNDIGGFGGTTGHTHDISGLYAQIARISGDLVSREESVPSWISTSRLRANTGGSNSASFTTGTNVSGSLSTVSHMPPYSTLNYIIKT